MSDLRTFKQTFLHDPENGVYGDCFPTVLACLLGLERDQVPHFYAEHEDAADASWAIREWLAARGLEEFTIEFPGTIEDLQTILYRVSNYNPGVHYMLTGKSRTGCHHVVICQAGQIVHDPSLTDAGIIGPCSDGCFCISFLVPYRGAPALAAAKRTVQS